MSRSRAEHGQQSIAPVPVKDVAAAIRRVKSMSRAEKEAVCDEILRRQPNLLGHVLVLSKLNVPMEKVDRVLHVLLVLHDLFTRAGSVELPTVAEDELEHIDDNFWALMRLLDSEEPAEAERLVRVATESHPEVNALAFAIGEMKEFGITDMTTKEDEYCVRAVRNLVDAFARARRAGR